MLSTTVHATVFALYVDDLCSQSILDLGERDLVNSLYRENRLRDLEAWCDGRFRTALAQREPARTIAALRQVTAFFKKIDIFRDASRCEAAALSAFNGAEAGCAVTNEILDNGLSFDDPIIQRARSIIADILGPFEDFYSNLKHYVKFSTGATSTLSRRESAVPKKCRGPLSINPDAEQHLVHLFGRVPRVRKTMTNKIAFVPKSYKTDRTIACEPTHSMCFQLAFDEYAKRRLRRIGIDLRDQTLNQLAAYKGSLDNSLATIDLSAASDSLSYNAVCALLPHDWFKFLTSVRSKFYRGAVRGKAFAGCYQKFSSMGNGSTFPLETLVFYALSKSVGCNTCIVYGDDIIVESEKTWSVVAILRLFGFKVNKDKTFYEPNHFRESCGTDWYAGVNVTPTYLRHLPRNIHRGISIEDKQKVVIFCNQLLQINSVIFGRIVNDLVARLRLPVGPQVQSLDKWVWTENVRFVYEEHDLYKQHPMCYGYATRTKTVYVRHSLAYVYSAMRGHDISSSTPLQAETITVGVKRCRVRVYRAHGCPGDEYTLGTAP